VRKLLLIGLAQALLLLAGCGGGGSGSLATTSNNNGGGGGGGGTSSGGGQSADSVNLIVDSGPQGNDVDTPFITITVCAPGSTSNCQQIDHIEVDTGSYGLRIMSSVLSSSLASALQQETVSGGNPVVECAQFADGFSWGPVKTADVQIAGESAASVPVEVIGDPAYLQSSSASGTTTSEIPSGCSSSGPEEDTVASFGANGIIGIGFFSSDCGSACALSPTNAQNPGFYYECPATGWSPGNPCNEIALAESAQVTNPVVFFQTDNNGVIVELPAASEGVSAISGSLIFGIGTQSNNSVTAKTLLTAGTPYDTINTTYTTTTGQQQFLPYSYFDTGSNAYYFADGGIPSATGCSGYPGYNSSNPDAWYCPGSELHLNATVTGQNGTQSSVSFSIGNTYTLFNTYTGSVFYDLGANSGVSVTTCDSQTKAVGDTSCAFDFGFPFFLGRNVFIAFAGANTAWGMGPYVAY